MLVGGTRQHSLISGEEEEEEEAGEERQRLTGAGSLCFRCAAAAANLTAAMEEVTSWRAEACCLEG